MIERKYHPYYEWEDYQSGMYDELKDGREHRVKLAVKLLSHPLICYQFMKEVTVRWKVATEHVFTNITCNRKSWLGQSACHLFAGVKEDETREAWKYLTIEQRKKANDIAKEVIKEWERRYEEGTWNKCV